MACKRCGQRKQVAVNVVNTSTPATPSTPATNTATVTRSSAGLNQKPNKIVTRNPHHTGAAKWVSDWAYLVVSLDGEPLDPAKFIYASEDGWVDMLDPNPMPTYSAARQEVVDVSKQRIRGTVKILSFAQNSCEDCREAMKKVAWWDSSYYTKEVAGNIVATQLTAEEREMAEKVRTQMWNTLPK
jgi:hypothetical protein